MQCPECHHENQEEAKFCEECGTKLGASESCHSVKKGTWRTYDATDGLPGAPDSLLQDRRGYLWIGTTAGLCRYDGTEFVTYTTAHGLAGNRVWALCEDDQAKLWVGTQRGISCFDGRQFINCTVTDELAGNNVRALCTDNQGRLWIGTGRGLFCFDGERFMTYTTNDGLLDDRVIALCAGSQGRLWIVTDRGLSCFDGQQFMTYTIDVGYRSCICEDSRGQLWIGSGDARKGFYCFDGEQFKTYTYDDGLADIQNFGFAVCEDHQGRMWFGAWLGVSCFDGSRFIKYSTGDGLWASGVWDIIEDREGQMWFAHGQLCGLSCYDAETVSLLTDRGAGWTSAQDKKGRIWNGGIAVTGISFDSESSEIEQRTFSFTSGGIRFLVDSRDQLWIAPYQDGVYCYDSSDAAWEAAGGNESSKPRHFGVSDSLTDKNYANPLLEMKDGTIWFSFHGAARLSRFDPEQLPDGKPLEFIDTKSVVHCLIEDSRGRLWMGGAQGGGLSCWDGGELTTYTQENGLPSDNITSLVEDDAGQIWVGTTHGLCCYDGKRFIAYGEEHRLRDLYHWVAVKDASGQLWFATRGGVYRTDGEHFQWLTEADGLPDNKVSGLLPQSDGSMIICAAHGIVRYQPTDKVPPQVEIREVIADQVYQSPKELEIATVGATHASPLITISYHGLSLATHRMRYSCILEGYDKEWKETWDKQVRYENLPVGEYTFKVIAINRDLVCSETPATLKLTVIPDPLEQRITELESELEEMRGKFEPIPNPYMAGGPVRSREMFFGREEHFRFVSSKLKTEKEGIIIVLYGQRRSGKTSLLHQIRNGRLGEDFMPVLIDMQEMAVRTEVEFYERITEEIAFGLMEWMDINAAEYDYRGEGENPTLVFRKFIDGIVEESDDKTLLLMFDEYELLEEKMDQDILSSDTPTFLAGILERYPRISFVFTGSRHLEARNPQYWGILFGKSTARKISLLSKRDALRLIAEPVSERVEYQEGVTERVYRLTGGQPFYTQHVCQLMIERLNEMERNQVYASDVEKVALELADNAVPQMMYFWNQELEAKERAILVLLGNLLKRPDRYATAEMVAEYAAAREDKVRVDKWEVERILDGLCQYEVLERDRVSEEKYEYRYKIDLFRYWVRRNQSIGQVMREMDQA